MYFFWMIIPTTFLPARHLKGGFIYTCMNYCFGLSLRWILKRGRWHENVGSTRLIMIWAATLRVYFLHEVSSQASLPLRINLG